MNFITSFSILCIFLSLCHFTPNRAMPKGQTPSVLTFGYDELRSGKGVSLIDINKKIKIKHLLFEQGKSAYRTMPLYINGFQEETNLFPKKRVIIFSYKNIIKAVDIDSDQIIWKVQIPFGRIYNTPVINIETKSLYVLGRSSDQKKRAFYHKLFLIKMNGIIEDSIYIDLSKFVNSRISKSFNGESFQESTVKQLWVSTRKYLPLMFFLAVL